MILNELHGDKPVSRETEPVFDSAYDIVVVGLGTAGAIALIAAARSGLSVLGVEQLYSMGGAGTVGSITGYYFGAQGGLFEEIDRKTAALEESLFVTRSRRDSKAFVLEREARASGADLKFNCIVTGVYKNGNALTGLRLFQEGSELRIKAKKIIDASGEAAVSHIAGAESTIGRNFDHSTQPFTFTSIAMDKNGKSFGLNKDSGYVRQNDPGDITRVIINANNYPLYLRENYSLTEIKFLTMAPLLGVREGRMIKGRKIVTLKDVISLSDSIKAPLFYTYSNVDNHGKDIALEDKDLCEWCIVAGLWGVLISVPIPADALIPEKLENIIVAGRCLSVDHNLASGVRMQRDMAKCGEAAAAVCVQAILDNVPLHQADYVKVAETLKASGCLDEKNNMGLTGRVFNQYLGEQLPSIKTTGDLTMVLDSEKPGWGIWMARILARGGDKKGESVVTALMENLQNPSLRLARNSALALGLLGNNSALDLLRKMAREPDNYIPKSSLKYIYTRGVSALYLLGKLGDTDSIKMLFDIIEKKGKTDLTGFVFDEFYQTEQDVFSEYVLFSARALLDIAEKHSPERDGILKRLTKIFDAPDYTLEVTLKENAQGLYDLKPTLAKYIRSLSDAYSI